LFWPACQCVLSCVTAIVVVAFCQLLNKDYYY